MRSHRTLIGALLAVAMFSGGSAQAIDYPTRPVIFSVGTAGGTTEPVFRFIMQKVNERHEFKYLVEPKPGANGIVSADYVARAKPDGYTLLLPSGAMPAWPGVYKKLPFDVLKDFEPVALIGKSQLVLVAAKSFPADTLSDLIKVAKANPGKYAYGSVGLGSINNIVGEELKQKTGIDLTHVPYTGSGDVVRGILSGDLALAVLPPTAVLQQINDNQIKAIAVLSPVRAPVLPSVPAAMESIPDLRGHEFWIGLMAPAGTPKEIIELVHGYVNEAMQDPDVVKSINNIGFQNMRASVEEFRTRLRDDVNDFRAISKAANITLD